MYSVYLSYQLIYWPAYFRLKPLQNILQQSIVCLLHLKKAASNLVLFYFLFPTFYTLQFTLQFSSILHDSIPNIGVRLQKIVFTTEKIEVHNTITSSCDHIVPWLHRNHISWIRTYCTQWFKHKLCENSFHFTN